MSVVVSEVQQLNNTRNNRTKRGNQNIQENIEFQRINFWDLILDQSQPNQSLSSVAKREMACAFDEFEQQRIIDGIRLFSEKNEEIKCFQERVTEDLASDYRSYVCGEMWLNLILERIRSQYYRNVQHFFFEFDQITNCSYIYNGNDNEISFTAKNIITKLKKEMKNYINENSVKKSKLLEKYMEYNNKQ